MVTRLKALGFMRYHLMKQAHWQRKVEARERENENMARAQIQGRARSKLSDNTPLEYYTKRVSQDDFWLKTFESKRDHHQKQALMWAQAAEALRGDTDAQ